MFLRVRSMGALNNELCYHRGDINDNVMRMQKK